jgi:hypothetical protein
MIYSRETKTCPVEKLTSDKDQLMSAIKHAPDELSPVEQAIEWHDGDLKATIATLIEDCRFLRHQLDMARKCMSHGLTRGWKPSPGR